MSKTILIIGGYGNTGKLVAELLLQHVPDVRVIISGRNEEKARGAAEQLNRDYTGNRADHIVADASDKASLVTAFHTADMVVMASGTMQYVSNVAHAAIETGTDYMDTQLSNPEKLNTLKEIKEITAHKRIFITDAGFHPGVPAALVRLAANKMDTLQSGIIYSALRIDWKQYEFSQSTVLEMMDEFRDFKPMVLIDGQWTKIKWKDMPKYDFGGDIGVEYCVPMIMNEFEKLPEMVPGLHETGFYVTGFNPVVDYIITPVVIAGLKLFPKSAVTLGKLFVWGLHNFSKPPYRTCLVLEAKGTRDGKPAAMQMRLSHSDPYFMTAAPIVACLKQYCSGQINTPGLWYQANIVEPESFFRDMESMGIQIVKQINS